MKAQCRKPHADMRPINDTQQGPLVEPPGDAVRRDGLAVAQHRRPVGNADQLGDLVRDDQHAFPRRLQLTHLDEQPHGGFEIELCGGFLQNQDVSSCRRFITLARQVLPA